MHDINSDELLGHIEVGLPSLLPHRCDRARWRHGALGQGSDWLALDSTTNRTRSRCGEDESLCSRRNVQTVRCSATYDVSRKAERRYSAY